MARFGTPAWLVNINSRHARYCILYPYKPYEMLGVTAPRFYVETKWAPPVKEIREASKSFPELTFHLDWWIEQDGPSGELVIRNGDDIDESFRPSSWYLFDDAVFYPTVSLLPAHLPYTLAQRGALRILDAIQTIEGLDRILSDRRFIDSPYSNERDQVALDQTKKTLTELLAQMRSSAAQLTFEGVFLGIEPIWRSDKASPAEMD